MKKLVFYISISLLASACSTSVTRMSATFGGLDVVILVEGLYNDGRGIDVTGGPVGDKIFAFSPQGSRPGTPFSILVSTERQFARQIGANKNLLCHMLNQNSSTNSNFAIWKPQEVAFNPLKTSFLTAISIEPDMEVHLLFSENQQTLSSGFNPSSSDFAALTISNNTLWARRLGVGYGRHTEHQRLGDFDTPEPRGKVVPASVLSVIFDRENNACKVVVAGANGSRINQTLGPDYCNISNSSNIVLAARAIPNGDISTDRFFCTSAMSVNSNR